MKSLSKLAVLGVALLAPSMALAMSGAIYTTTGTGTTVNQNTYPSKDAVFLNGGPQNLNAGGLTDGTYYFEVTNPSGSVLLSTDDAVCRIVTVVGGKLAGAAPSSCAHANATANAANGSLGVQLVPYNDTPNSGGEYKVWLVDATCATADGPKLSFKGSCAQKTDNFKVETVDGGGECTTCGTDTRVTIGGHKYYDVNTDGDWDTTEAAIGGFRIDLNVNGIDHPLFTEADGSWFLTVVKGASFSACELQASGPWFQTGPIDGAMAGTAIAANDCWSGSATENNVALDFGNVCTGKGGGLTLGFWSNKNGGAILSAGGNAVLNQVLALNLRTANGSLLGSVSLGTYQKFLTGANASNMANMLSAQLAAMKGNVASGKVNGGGYVYGGGSLPVSLLNANGYITVNDLMAAANASLGTNGVTIASGPTRTYQEQLKTMLDRLNNDQGLYVQATACAVVYQ